MLPSLINNNKIGVKLIKELLLGNILANPAPPIPSEESKRPTGEAEMPVQATHVEAAQQLLQSDDDGPNLVICDVEQDVQRGFLSRSESSVSHIIPFRIQSKAHDLRLQKKMQ